MDLLTNSRTDRQTQDDSVYRASIASRGKKKLTSASRSLSYNEFGYRIYKLVFYSNTL